MVSDNQRAVEALGRLSDPAAISIGLAFTAAVSETFRFWSSRGGVAIAAPSVIESISSPSGLGSDSVPVPVQLNSRNAYLTDSAQFVLELATRTLQRASFYVMPCFRGEKSDATHLAEFVHAEVELSGGLADVLDAAEEYIRAVIAAVRTALPAAAQPAHEADPVLPRFRRAANSATGPWARVTYLDAIDSLHE